MFEFPDFKISSKHLEKIKMSIQQKNLCKDYPILVTPDDYKVIEGRYRFLACYDLQIPIYYKVAEVTTHKDAIRIKHIHKNIHLDDVIGVYAEISPYGDILKLRGELSNYFSATEILYCIDEAQYKRIVKEVYHPKIDRQLIDSGALPQWDYNKTRGRLVRIKGFLEKYSQYGWSFKDAHYLLNEKPKIFSQAEDKLAKNTLAFLNTYREIANNNGGWNKEKQCYNTAPDGTGYSMFHYVLPNGYINLHNGREIPATFDFLIQITQANFKGINHQTREALISAGILTKDQSKLSLFRESTPRAPK